MRTMRHNRQTPSPSHFIHPILLLAIAQIVLFLPITNAYSILSISAKQKSSSSSSSSSPSSTTTSKNTRSRVKDTKVNVFGKSSASVSPPTNAKKDNVTLTQYMRLPVEQYVLIPMPLGSSLTRKRRESDVEVGLVENTVGDCDGVVREGNEVTLNSEQESFPPKSSQSSKDLPGEEFELVVPTITFFQLSLQPVVYATVHPNEHQVVISSEKCLVRGSPFVDKVKLNDRFDFRVKTTLTWKDSLTSQPGQGSSSQMSKRKSNKSNESHSPIECTIDAETTIHVDVDVPRPFSSIPKAILERTGNAAMRLSMKYIQGNFVNNLAKDYEKWANDVGYRSFRASLSDIEKREKNEDGVIGEVSLLDNDSLLINLQEAAL